MNIFKKKERRAAPARISFCSEQGGGSPYKLAADSEYLESGIYDALRCEVPLIDACIGKIVRLTGDFTVKANEKRYQPLLDKFCDEVSVGVSGRSIHTFADMYLDSLLTYGKAIGRIIADPKSLSIKGVYVCDSSMYDVKQGKNPLEKDFYFRVSGEEVKVEDADKLIYTTLNPNPKHPDGVSLLRGLPAMSDILKRIYRCIGQNFDRVGNVRYAVTYKPDGECGDRGLAKERALEIAKAWGDGMTSAKYGIVKDFVAVGDVDIKVIGAENQVIDTEVPVRQLLEQLIAKLSVPPFLLGLNWSTTERMSSQQADILTSELEYYRRLLTPVITKICSDFLQLCGSAKGAYVEWANINLQDEEAIARSRLLNAQAEALEIENSEKKNEKEVLTDGKIL